MLGIDLGTTWSKMAHIDPAGKPISILNDRGDPSTPTVVYIPVSGEPLIGADAIEQGYTDPSRCLRNFKLDLGSTKNLMNNGQVVIATDAAALFLGPLKRWQKSNSALMSVTALLPAQLTSGMTPSKHFVKRAKKLV